MRRISFEYVSGSGSHSLRGLDTCSITQRVCYFQQAVKGIGAKEGRRECKCERESAKEGVGVAEARIKINIGYAFALCVRHK